ncbi:MAG: phosphoribosylamine--glycine ligase [Bacteroidetes bacterium]|nr:phosphoribosylamine--glycine ligase [Bacteroidota bacterium]
MNILLLGSGGREHALAWKISQSKKVKKLYIAPGNAGTMQVGENVDLKLSNFESIKQFVLKMEINMVVVGPEQPLVDGFSDFFNDDEQLKQVSVIGPVKAGAILEGSKDFAKDFMQRYSIPTAKYRSFNKTEIEEGKQFLESMKAPYVLKADGLAAGKGVLILENLEEAKKALEEMLSGKFGDASATVVIEEYLNGIELSVFVLTDGKSYKILPEAKDYKRIGEGDTGLNTGGMGAVSPVPFASSEFMQKVEKRVIIPTINGLQNENIDYRGFIFLGLMNVDGDPFVIEYNVRMGDPETEVVIPRIKSDLAELLKHTADQTLEKTIIEIDERTCTTVMLVSEGYPGAYEKGKVIHDLEKVKESILFHAGTKNTNNKITTNGGRVIAVSSYGNNMDEALEKSYRNASIVNFEGKNYRKDIGFDLKQ